MGLGWGGVRVSGAFMSNCSSSIGTSVTGLCRMDQLKEWCGSAPQKARHCGFGQARARDIEKCWVKLIWLGLTPKPFMCLCHKPGHFLFESAYARPFRPTDQHFTPLRGEREAVNCIEIAVILHCAPGTSMVLGRSLGKKSARQDTLG